MFNCFQNICLGTIFFFFILAGGYSDMKTQMDGYLFWIPVASAILTTHFLKNDNTIVKCTT